MRRVRSLLATGDRFLGGPIVGFGDPQAESPQRHIGGAPRQVRETLDHFRRITTAHDKQVERFVVDDRAVRAVRPVGMAHAVRHATRRVDEYSPRGFAGARAPAERNVLVREPGVDAKRVLHLRLDQLPALVEGAELFAQPVHRIAGAEREARDPLQARSPPADHWHARETAEVLVGDRRQDALAILEELDRQRLAANLQARVAGRERPDTGRRLRDVAALRSAQDEAVVGLGVGADAKPEQAGPEARDLEDVAGIGRERRTGRGRAETVGRIESDEGGAVEFHRCLVSVFVRRFTRQPANFGSGKPATSTLIENSPPDWGSRASSSASRN